MVTIVVRNKSLEVFSFVLKRIIWKSNLINFKARGVILVNLNREGCMRSMR
jgi:hypothetical protein